MFEFGGTWEVVGGDGTSVAMNDGSGVLLLEVAGFDSPNVRTNIDDIPEGDGAIAGDSFYGSRPVTLRGQIVNVDAATRNLLLTDLQRAFRGLRTNCTLKASPSGMPAMQISGRVDGFRISGGMAKEWFASVNCPDPRIYSQAENTSHDTGTAGSPGATFPLEFPVNFGGTSGATVSVPVTNYGNFDAPVIVRATGPIQNPQFRNGTTGESFYIDGVTLASGEWVEVNTALPPDRAVTDFNGTSLYRYVRFPGSTWWQLAAGNNAVELWGNGTDSTTRLDVTWRSAWA